MSIHVSKKKVCDQCFEEIKDMVFVVGDDNVFYATTLKARMISTSINFKCLMKKIFLTICYCAKWQKLTCNMIDIILFLYNFYTVGKTEFYANSGDLRD